MNYTITDIANIIEASVEVGNDIDQSITILLTDSRQLSIPSQTLFFAITGYRRDGHDYIAELIKRGVKNFVVSDRSIIYKYRQLNLLLVDDVIGALQKLSIFHRHQFEIPVLGIAGSNGKTMVKEWLASMISTEVNLHRSPKSYNSQIGVPLSVWELNEAHELAIFEAGISLPNEMINLESIIKPTIGLITNIGSAHDAGFESRKQKLEEKLKLFQSADRIIYCKDHSNIDEAIRQMQIPRLTWGRTEQADIIYEKRDDYLTVNYQGKERSFECQNEEQYLIENYLSCIAFCLLMGYDIESDALLHLPSIEMRTQLIKGENNCLIVQDAYSADMSSMAQVLAYCQRNKGKRELIVVLTDFLQSGQQAKDLYQHMGEMLRNHDVKTVYAIGDEVSELSKYHPIHHFITVHDFQEHLSDLEWQDKLILLKGARKYKLEEIAKQLQEKYHETFLEVNMGAIARNFKTLERFIPQNCKVLVMVKANAYGAGIDQLAHFYESRQVDYFGVAYVDEGVQLRKAGVKKPILVLNTERSGYEQLVQYGLEPELFSFEVLNSFIHFCRSRGLEDYPVHIKLETGMNRLGFVATDIEELKVIFKSTKELKVVGVMSHLAASDDPKEDAFTQHQLSQFKSLYEELTADFDHEPIRHILNSHGVVNYSEHCMDMVRLGIGLYGYLENISDKVILEPTHTLKARISQIKRLNKGDTIGYSRKSKAYEGQKIAIINIGYADGLFRLAGNKRFNVYLKNRFLPIVGNVCMDMCMIDITEIEDLKVRDEVEIFGSNNPIENLAKACLTIPYEILTSISSRVTRIYIDE